MNFKIRDRMHEIVRDSGLRPARALEVGGYVGDKSLLRSAEIQDAERFCVNLVEQPNDTGIRPVVGNANHMDMFDDGAFDLVLSNAVLEHDKHFWLSLAEMKRVIRPGGLLIISVPGFVKNRETKKGRSTSTYRVHYRFDYYRFSSQAVRDVFFADMDNVTVASLLRPPRIIGSGYKPSQEYRGAQT
ncbi:MAG: methyltransferase domain-containing protein [Actinomycetota bacterium]|nr:methyltransferase domain-containing protein [Actinomycetota bacterium]